MNEAVSRGLSRVLRIQLAAVQQHFIHILSLRAWKEAAVADRITSIDAVDLPNAMRIVDCLVSAGHLPALASDREALAGDMPEPGGSLDTVLAAELALDLRLGNVLASVERELTPCARVRARCRSSSYPFPSQAGTPTRTGCGSGSTVRATERRPAARKTRRRSASTRSSRTSWS